MVLDRWRELFGVVGESFLDLVWAEIGELEGDLGRSGRVLVRALIAFMLAGILLFYATAGIGVLAIVLLNRIWPLWAAALTVTGALLLVAGIAVLVGARWVRSLESPVSTVRRRMDNHVQWWQQEILRTEGDPRGSGDDSPPASGGAPAAGGSG